MLFSLHFNHSADDVINTRCVSLKTTYIPFITILTTERGPLPPSQYTYPLDISYFMHCAYLDTMLRALRWYIAGA